ncbi:MAG: FkbM family methyltransferase [Rhodobacter sp.]|jgi:FkbM family methyltransferase|nr:FkbM family methyltransferase [Rhodobacter sp.]
MLERDQVIWAYQELLGREPENQLVIEQKRYAQDLGALVREIVESREYLFNSRRKITAADVAWGYHEFLGREPESDAVLAAGVASGSLGNLIRNLLGSDEFRIREPRVFALMNQWLIFESPHGFRLWVNMADVGVSGQVMRGTYETDEVAFITSILKPGQAVIDIGANIGYLTHMMAMAVGSSGKVISFEPHPIIYERLALSVAENGFAQCETHNMALGDVADDGILEFGLDGANFGGMRLLGTEAPADVAICKVPIRRLDDVIDPSQRIDFIKIDVEGSEPLVVRGANSLIRTHRPIIVSEILGRSLREMHGMTAADYIFQVCELGYQCRSLTAGGTVGEVFEPTGMVEFANVIFLPKT